MTEVPELLSTLLETMSDDDREAEETTVGALWAEPADDREPVATVEEDGAPCWEAEELDAMGEHLASAREAAANAQSACTGVRSLMFASFSAKLRNGTALGLREQERFAFRGRSRSISMIVACASILTPTGMSGPWQTCVS